MIVTSYTEAAAERNRSARVQQASEQRVLKQVSQELESKQSVWQAESDQMRLTAAAERAVLEEKLKEANADRAALERRVADLQANLEAEQSAHATYGYILWNCRRNRFVLLVLQCLNSFSSIFIRLRKAHGETQLQLEEARHSLAEETRAGQLVLEQERQARQRAHLEREQLSVRLRLAEAETVRANQLLDARQAAAEEARQTLKTELNQLQTSLERTQEEAARQQQRMQAELTQLQTAARADREAAAKILAVRI